MRAGLSTIQQTLTPEAASVLNQSIAEAGRRNHGQTTPLHVAAMLLASQSGFLRQACIRSHPNSSHPLQCRALELCFSVALERLPTAAQPHPPSSSSSAAAASPEPPISNALMAALKRAQAHQRRGCPEQQQQPLLAVKVELEQLVISILDDPSVSRVMREASFSSPAVKATIEQTLISTPQQPPANAIGLGFRPPPRNLYLNPRLQQTRSSDDVGKVIDILTRSRKRNPVIVGDAEPAAVLKSVLKKIENRETDDGVLKGVVEVVSLETHLGSSRTNMGLRIKELGDLVGTRIGSGSVILDLGDLKWLVESSVGRQQPSVAPDEGQAAVVEMGKLLDRFRDGNNGSCRLWLIGLATCETYLKCQVYHPSMENVWDLQAVPIAARAPQPPTGFSRLGPRGILGRSFENVNPLKIENISTAAANPSPAPRIFNGAELSLRTSCCPQCTQNYEEDLAKLIAEESKNSSKPEPAKPPLPPWLQIARTQVPETKSPDQSQTKDQEEIWKQKIQELQKKWHDTCLHHSSLGSEQVIPASLGLCGSNLISRVPLHVPPKPYARNRIDENLHLSHNAAARQPSEQSSTPPRSPVTTELVLGHTKQNPSLTSPEKAYQESLKALDYISSKTQQSWLPELQQSHTADVDFLKRLLKSLVQKVWWQQEAASAAAASVIQFRLGRRRRPSAATSGVRSRVDMWLMFLGPDRIGKRKIASILSQEVCSTRPLILCLGSRCDAAEEPEAGFRGKTVLDRIVEAVKRNPSSVIMLEDVDEADALLCRSIKHAMEMGRLVDSHGREISLGSIIFILTAKWLPKNENITDLKDAASSLDDDAKLANIASGSWQLRLSVCKKSNKRQANWLQEDEHRGTKLMRKEITSTLAFDLNESASNAEDDIMDGSHNSSDLTFDHEDELGLEMKRLPTLPQFLNSVDDAIVFKPVDLGSVRRQMASLIASKFTAVIGNALPSIEVDDKALERIVGGVWHGCMELEEWAEKVLIPNFHHLKAMLPSSVEHEATSNVLVRLEPDGDSGDRCAGEWLPSKIKVVVLDELGW